MSLICFISTMLVINQSCNGTIKALHGQARNKKIVNIVKVIYLPQQITFTLSLRLVRAENQLCRFVIFFPGLTQKCALLVSATIFKQELPTAICISSLNHVDDIVTTIYKDISSTSTRQLYLPAIFLNRRPIFASCRMILYIKRILVDLHSHVRGRWVITIPRGSQWGDDFHGQRLKFYQPWSLCPMAEV